jgi:D,D-heptose 1,7-bisphosphate phosphatase
MTLLSQRKGIFLDRDGVINPYVYNQEFGTVDSPSSPDEFTVNSGVGEAIVEFKSLGLVVIVVSNQPGIAKGKFTQTLLEQVTRKMRIQIEAAGGKIDAVYHCLHHPEAVVPAYRVRCECRKPRPGMLLAAAKDWGLSLKDSYMVGDGITDIEAGRAAGTRTIFVGQLKPYIVDEFERHGVRPDFIVPGLPEAAKLITNLENGTRAQVLNGSVSTDRTEVPVPE